MSNEELELLWEVAIEKEADKCAEDQKMTNKILSKMFLKYVESYNHFLKINKKEIDEFVETANNDKNYCLKNSKVFGLLKFLVQGVYLINQQGELNDETFQNYKLINSSKGLIEFEDTLDYAEDILKWSKTRKLNDELQFILAFYNDANLRQGYFKTALLEVKKNEKFKSQDYRSDIFEKAFELFRPKIKQYNCL